MIIHRQNMIIPNPNTIIHINVPNANSFHRLLAVEMGLIENVFELSKNNVSFQQQNVFDLNKLIELVEKLDFKIIESFSISPAILERSFPMFSANNNAALLEI